MPPGMKPAWKISYALKGYDSEGQLTGWRWEGIAEIDRLRLVGASEDDEPKILGRAEITSWQPYRRDALKETQRVAWDLCGIVGAAVGGLTVEPVLPADRVERLEGAKEASGVAVKTSMTFAVTQRLDSKDRWLEAIQRLEECPELRADLDTLHIAKREHDAASRTVNLYRIYDAYARSVLEELGPLVTQAQRKDILAAAESAFPEDLDPQARERLKGAMATSLSRVREHARLDVLLERFKQLAKGVSVSKEVLQRIDSRRGQVAHNPTVLQEAAGDKETERILFELVTSILKDRLGLNPKEEAPGKEAA